jgi:penicillin-binding protein 1C
VKAVVASLAIVAVVTAAVIGIRFAPREPLATRIPSSTAVFDEHGRLLRLTLASDQQYRLWTPLNEATQEFVDALLLHEDQHFYGHAGFNPAALARAAFSSSSGGPHMGGSTITMQLARLMYGLNTRSVGGKLQQIVRAVQLEMCYSKREILEAHINLMPYGGNIQGVGAASLIYFDKPAARLDIAESLALVLIPQSPARRAPSGREGEELRSARQRLFARWVEEHPRAADSSQHVAMALQFGSMRELPFSAPHFTNYVLQKAEDHSIRTTLDSRLQSLIERVLANYIRERSSTGVHNASAMLVDYRDMSVRAMIGSADFNSAAIDGQVNGTLAKRSPGSALKPFIYALAIDQGLIHPLTVLKDAPTSFGPYSPENFDGRFVGPITATEALARSRNVPAVALSAQLSQPNLYDFLKVAGVSHLASERHYGLALTLGGGEVTPEELATLYAMLANRGRLAPLRYLADERNEPGPRLLSEEASFMTLEMLRSAPRPDDAFAQRRSSVPVAWKTGTSWGFRDAWTAGVFGPYVLVVWVGNFDGSGNPAFVGVQTAAPLFFRIVDAIGATSKLIEPAYRQPPRLERVDVCSASGDLPNAECPQTVSTWYIPGISPIRVSQVHRRVWIDTRTGDQACPPYDPQFTRSEVFEYWPTELLQLFAQAGMPRRRPPPAADCQRDLPSGTPPHITSPVTAATYTIRAGRVGNEPVPLAANADSEVRRLHWFVDESYVGTSAPGIALAWNPHGSGHYVVRTVDDRGRADSRPLDVALVR